MDEKFEWNIKSINLKLKSTKNYLCETWGWKSVNMGKSKDENKKGRPSHKVVSLIMDSCEKLSSGPEQYFEPKELNSTKTII